MTRIVVSQPRPILGESRVRDVADPACRGHVISMLQPLSDPKAWSWEGLSRMSKDIEAASIAVSEASWSLARLR
jgi:hypothetical protein